MNNEKSISIIIESLKIIILKFIKNNLEEFFNNKTEYIDEMLFFLFPDNSNQRILLLKVATLFLILYTEFYNKSIEEKNKHLYDLLFFYRFTLIKTSGCSTPASRVSIRNDVSKDAGTPLVIPGPSTRTLFGSKFGRT